MSGAGPTIPGEGGRTSEWRPLKPGTYNRFMPLYEYDCRECGKRFEVIVQGRTTPECPACHGTSLERALSTFAVSSNGRTAAQSGPGPCGTCGDPRGPGACSLN